MVLFLTDLCYSLKNTKLKLKTKFLLPPLSLFSCHYSHHYYLGGQDLILLLPIFSTPGGFQHGHTSNISAGTLRNYTLLLFYTNGLQLNMETYFARFISFSKPAVLIDRQSKFCFKHLIDTDVTIFADEVLIKYLTY